MKKAMCLLFVALAWLNPDTSWSQYPQVDFVFGYCPSTVAAKVGPNSPLTKAGTMSCVLKPAFRAEWSKEAPILLGETIAALNAPFRRNELTAFIRGARSIHE